MEYRKSSHSVYLTYHMVIVTKYQKPCITDEIGDFMKAEAARLLELNGGSLISADTDTDHMHLLIEIPPALAPAVMLQVLKTQLSRSAMKNMEEIRKYLYGEGERIHRQSAYRRTQT